MLHELIKVWFEWSRQMGYTGVFLMMALESTIVPVPSEIIMPPAGYWAEQGQMSLWGVILAGGLGSTLEPLLLVFLHGWAGGVDALWQVAAAAAGAARNGGALAG
jgi:membrane protein DedA with SNARE-associated domain